MKSLFVFLVVSAAGWVALWVSSIVMMSRSSNAAETRITIWTCAISTAALAAGLFALGGVQ